MPQLGQGGISLPDRDYYLVDNSRNKEIKSAYKEYVNTLMKLTSQLDHDSSGHFDTLWKIEKDLAQAQKSRVEMRDPQKTYNKFSLSAFSTQTPPFNWKEVLTGLKLKEVDTRSEEHTSELKSQ